MRRRSILAAGSAAALSAPVLRPHGAAASEEPVDVAIVLAVDVSRSIDADEARLQREGYRAAVRDPRIVEAIRGGMIGAVGLAYVEWAGIEYQQLVIPWTRIAAQADADAWAEALERAPRVSLRRTSISGAIEFGSRLFETSGYRGTRRVIDVSGDGANNHGQIITIARDEALAKGITINGLPFMAKRLNYATMDIERLDIYYEDCVIGGPGSFVIPIEGPERFVEATRTKLVLEIAGLVPPVRIIPASARTPRVSCTIGERLWQERWGN